MFVPHEARWVILTDSMHYTQRVHVDVLVGLDKEERHAALLVVTELTEGKTTL